MVKFLEKEEFENVVIACKQYLKTLLGDERHSNDDLKEIKDVKGLIVLYESKIEHINQLECYNP